MAVYGYLFWLTYYDMTKGALLWYNLATIGFVCFDVTYMGWDSGIQHFLFIERKNCLLIHLPIPPL